MFLFQGKTATARLLSRQTTTKPLEESDPKITSDTFREDNLYPLQASIVAAQNAFATERDMDAMHLSNVEAAIQDSLTQVVVGMRALHKARNISDRDKQAYESELIAARESLTDLHIGILEKEKIMLMGRKEQPTTRTMYTDRLSAIKKELHAAECTVRVVDPTSTIISQSEIEGFEGAQVEARKIITDVQELETQVEGLGFVESELKTNQQTVQNLLSDAVALEVDAYARMYAPEKLSPGFTKMIQKDAADLEKKFGHVTADRKHLCLAVISAHQDQEKQLLRDIWALPESAAESLSTVKAAAVDRYAKCHKLKTQMDHAYTREKPSES